MSKTVFEMAREVWSAGDVYIGPSEKTLELFVELVRADDIAAIEGLERSSIWITREEAIAAIRARGSNT